MVYSVALPQIEGPSTLSPVSAEADGTVHAHAANTTNAARPLIIASSNRSYARQRPSISELTRRGGSSPARQSGIHYRLTTLAPARSRARGYRDRRLASDTAPTFAAVTGEIVAGSGSRSRKSPSQEAPAVRVTVAGEGRLRSRP
jgi:hypothetical protein